MGLLKEFREFAVKGNVVDMAVGVIIGAAFGSIVTSLVNDVVMPPIGMVVSNVNFADRAIVLRPADEVNKKPAVVIGYGKFINTVINFMIVAAVIFLVIKQINRLKREGPPPSPTTRECPHCLSSIPMKASRCAHCTAEVQPVA
ncbi:MAG: large-conductance mechanosensitive channel protein MscL [Planctomycetia bacterium]|nr:large-conductance mechanosensitive channel protein MscL [Planctomycetia bacterium]